MVTNNKITNACKGFMTGEAIACLIGVAFILSLSAGVIVQKKKRHDLLTHAAERQMAQNIWQAQQQNAQYALPADWRWSEPTSVAAGKLGEERAEKPDETQGSDLDALRVRTLISPSGVRLQMVAP